MTQEGYTEVETAYGWDGEVSEFAGYVERAISHADEEDIERRPQA